MIDEEAKEIADVRPGPQGKPFAWAESRQELCETLPYYKAYQSGCYTKTASTSSRHLRELRGESILRDGTAYGYLLAGFGASRDAWEHQGRVIISHGGGKSRSVSDSNQVACMQLMENQSRDDPKIASLIQSSEMQTPVVLIMAADYTLSHFRLPCAFAVLGWYWVTDHWCERESDLDEEKGCVRYKFRFQYIEAQGQPWWLKGDGPQCANEETMTRLREQRKASPHTPRAPKTPWTSSRMIRRKSNLKSSAIKDVSYGKKTCLHCCRASPQIFRDEWICLSSDCTAFWKPSVLSQGTFDFTLHSKFIRLREEPAHYALGSLPSTLMPPREIHVGGIEPLSGFHCPCGRLNSRQYVGYWHCASCGNVKMDVRGLDQSRLTASPSLAHMDDFWINEDAGITFAIQRWKDEGVESMTFIMPKGLGGGRVHLIRSISCVDRAEDAIFKSLTERSCTNTPSEDVIPFQRHPLNCHTVKGAFLSQQFTCNYGVEYKHAVKMGTTPLKDAAACVKDALGLIHRRTAKVISKENLTRFLPFNELYPVLYLQSQKMNFHDDGEPGLGPVISTLSLGVEAKIMFRLKEKYTMDSASKAQSTTKANLSVQDRLLLTIPLHHGSVLVQEGYQLQEMMEHAVHPQHSSGQQGNMSVRIAIAARHINEKRDASLIATMK